MGAPKQKWTSREEVALKAGVDKYGPGKWSTILKDPEFSSILRLRSNVDLKDKWRNMRTPNGCGSRQRSRHAVKNNQQITSHDDKTMTLSPTNQSDAEVVDARPLAISSRTLQNADSKEPFPRCRLDDLILDAVNNLKEPRGSSRTAIAMYIEEKYLAPRKLERLLAANLKLLMENGKLIKVKHRYRITPSSTFSNVRTDPSPLLLEGNQKNCVGNDSSPLLPLEGKQKNCVRKDSPPLLLLEGKPKKSPKLEDIKLLTKSQIEAELDKMRTMTAHEAAAAAAQAVADAEAAIAEAEEAAREAEAAEAEAEAAQAFAEVAMKALKFRTIHIW